jgi:hypothetical protein
MISERDTPLLHESCTEVQARPSARGKAMRLRRLRAPSRAPRSSMSGCRVSIWQIVMPRPGSSSCLGLAARRASTTFNSICAAWFSGQGRHGDSEGMYCDYKRRRAESASFARSRTVFKNSFDCPMKRPSPAKNSMVALAPPNLSVSGRMAAHRGSLGLMNSAGTGKMRLVWKSGSPFALKSGKVSPLSVTGV